MFTINIVVIVNLKGKSIVVHTPVINSVFMARVPKRVYSAQWPRELA